MAKKVIPFQKPTSSLISDTKSFGAFIKYKRTQSALTIEEAAALCNLNYRTYEKIEKGDDGAKLSTALYVARMFGLKLDMNE